jgi:hypothetical protein
MRKANNSHVCCKLSGEKETLLYSAIQNENSFKSGLEYYSQPYYTLAMPWNSGFFMNIHPLHPTSAVTSYKFVLKKSDPPLLCTSSCLMSQTWSFWNLMHQILVLQMLCGVCMADNQATIVSSKSKPWTLESWLLCSHIFSGS